MAAIDRPLKSPERSLVGFRPIKALGHFRKLMADKEDTEQVFHIIEALKGRKTARQAATFVQSPEGRALIESDYDIPAHLDNHSLWADCEQESVAQTYIRFMKREGLSAAGLVEESYKWLAKDQRPQDLYEWYFERVRDTHDLFHVLTGYGRDPLGELCLLGFSYAQNHNHGVQFIAFAGSHQLRRETGTKAPIAAAVAEGKRLGAAAAKIAHEDIEPLMRETLADARRRLNIGAPNQYLQCLKILQSEGWTGDGGRPDFEAQAA